jgi:hypothetical protein
MTKFLNAMVLTGQGPDRVTLFTNLPSSFASAYPDDNLAISFEAEAGSGAEYTRKNFGLEPAIIHRTNIKSGK